MLEVTREQLMAQKAFERVSGVAEQEKKAQKEYSRFAKQLPAIIHSCGLCQALAFAVAKKHEKIVGDLAHVLGGGQEKLLEQARELDALQYMRLNRQALSAASWLKRYSEALLAESEE